MRALAIAATGMSAQQLNVEVVANNIANINTTSYKRSRAEFTDLFYQIDRMQGVPNRAGEAAVPEGAKLGLGVRSVAVRKLHMQGSLAQTGNPYDLAVNGRGWFQIAGPNGETLYTRAGAFNTNADRQLVTADGYTVDPTIIIPQGTVEVTVNESGQVFAKLDNEIAPRQVGQLNLTNFANEAGLDPLGGNLYRETLASGIAVVGVPGDPGYGKIHQRYLESSNVDLSNELVTLIAFQRACQANAKTVTTADEMMQDVNNLKR